MTPSKPPQPTQPATSANPTPTPANPTPDPAMLADLHRTLAEWFVAHRRDLPWRREPGPWGVLVSEVMLHQTPVARVVEPWQEWIDRWPAPAALAAAAPADAIRAWGRLGYPRRALRLHEAATVIVGRHGGAVPTGYEQLLSLPGVGPYTAAAVVSFAYRGRAAVLDVNVRRLYARLFDGRPSAAGQVSAAERARAEALLPTSPSEAADWAGATMELAQLVCTARDPACGDCPVSRHCRWLAAGQPGATERTTRPQSYAGTDRQVRGTIMARLREGPATRGDIDLLWPDRVQLTRALASLVADRLAVRDGDRMLLPGDQ